MDVSLATASPANGAASIQGRGVVKSFGGFTAVDGLDLDIRSGEFVSLIGPSGCGKSTFMLMAAGLIPVSSGELLVDGRKLTSPLTDIGIVFQDHLLLEFRTALENVLLQAEIRGLPLAPAKERALELFAKLGISHAVDRYPKQLSGGMRQRVSIARALVTSPRMLLMDEPFGALDEFTRDRLNEELRRIWQETRTTILFVTHSVYESVYLGESVLVLAANPGRVRQQVNIDLPRDRTLAIRDTEQFVRVAAGLRKSLEH